MTCTACGKPVLVTIYRGTGACSGNCLKILSGDVDEVPARVSAS